ncbi:MAG: hypothetical protein GXO61_01695 [Epsilonproteobacteria bacterium]|nr:hypothetical protein [Campylobacterota bacterium]
MVGLLLATLLGCEKKIYQRHYTTASTKIKCLTLQSDNLLIKELLKPLYPFSKKCPFTLKTTSNFLSQCTSAYSKAFGSDFDGFLRLEVFEREKLLFRNQIDFKGSLDEKVVKKLFLNLKTQLPLEEAQ